MHRVLFTGLLVGERHWERHWERGHPCPHFQHRRRPGVKGKTKSAFDFCGADILSAHLYRCAFTVPHKTKPNTTGNTDSDFEIRRSLSTAIARVADSSRRPMFVWGSVRPVDYETE